MIQQPEVMQDSGETVQVEVQLFEDTDAIYDPVNGEIKHEIEEVDESEVGLKPVDFSQKHRNSVSTLTAEENEDEEMIILEDDENLYNGGQLELQRLSMPPISDDEPDDEDLRSETSGTDDGTGTGSGRNSRSNGLYSLKNYAGQYRKERTESGSEFVCNNCNAFRAKSQITLIRHFWNEGNKKDFYCEAEGCNRKFDNEFSRYKHRKFEHRQSPPPPPSQIPGQILMGNNNQLPVGSVEMPPEMGNSRPLFASSLPQGVGPTSGLPLMQDQMQLELLQQMLVQMVAQQQQHQQFGMPIDNSGQIQLQLLPHQGTGNFVK